jgi:hypothetical protein
MKKALLSVLAAAVLSTAWPAPAQCIGYLIPKGAKLWKEGEGDDQRPGERAEYLPAVHRRGFNPGAGVKLRKGFTLSWQGGCRVEDAEQNKKTKRVLLVLLDARTEDFEEAWAVPTELLTFKYDSPASDQDGPENVAAIRKAADLALDEIRVKTFKRPAIESQRDFRASFGATWSALIETMSAQKWQVERIDKGSGLVTTKPSSDKSGSMMACATKYDERNTVFLNVFAKAVARGVRVTINTTFQATREKKSISCYSNGSLEKEFFDGIAKSLAKAVPAKKPRLVKP